MGFEWGVVSEGSQTWRENSSSSAGTYSLTDSGNERKITWYFTPTTNQTRTFTLSYTAHGAVRIYPEGDQFWWKFIESGRGYTISASRVTVHLPAAADVNKMRATTYLGSSEVPGAGRIADGSTFEFTSGPFSSGVEWELRAQFPHGTVNANPPPWQTADDQLRENEARLKGQQNVFNLIALVISVVVLISGFLGLFLLWYTRGRDKPAGLVSEYLPKPPENIPPGVAGTLVDESADMQDIIATVVDLARRGFMRIVEKSEPGFLGIGTTREFTYERLKDGGADLRPYEQKLFDKIFSSGDSIGLDELRNKFYTALPDIKDGLYDETVKEGYFGRTPHRTKLIYGGIGVAALVLVGACGFLGYALISDYAPLAICVLIAFGASALGLIVLSPFMPKKTDKGSVSAAKWRAFKRYLENVEKYTNVAEAKEQFDKYLPYAIAFGLEHSWMQKFQAVNTPAPIWYQPYGWSSYPAHSPGTLSPDLSNQGASGGVQLSGTI